MMLLEQWLRPVILPHQFPLQFNMSILHFQILYVFCSFDGMWRLKKKRIDFYQHCCFVVSHCTDFATTHYSLFKHSRLTHPSPIPLHSEEPLGNGARSFYERTTKQSVWSSMYSNTKLCYCYIGKLLTLTRSIKHLNVSFEIYIPVIHSKTALNARSSHTSEVIALTLELKHLI